MSDDCTHEITEWGLCAGCGAEVDRPICDTPPRRSGCHGRGWYHDGSEQEDARLHGRTPRPCPHHREDTP